MFTNTVSDSTLQLTFKKLLHVEFWRIIEEEYTQLPEKANEIFLPFPISHLHEAWLFLHTSNKATYCKILTADTDMEI